MIHLTCGAEAEGAEVARSAGHDGRVVLATAERPHSSVPAQHAPSAAASAAASTTAGAATGAAAGAIAGGGGLKGRRWWPGAGHVLAVLDAA